VFPSSAETRAREAARRVLHACWVQRPEHIDLEVLAWRDGLTIHTGGLETADGRLVASPARGFIRVRDGIKSAGRRRFVVGHELGHFHLHKRQIYTDTARELSTWRADDPETEANLFAAELLMPDFLFEPRIRNRPPSHGMLKGVAGEFATSHLATVIQYLTYTSEPCALVYAREGAVRWARSSPAWAWALIDGAVPAASGAGVFHATGRVPPYGLTTIAPESWIAPRDLRASDGVTLAEDTLVWPEQRVTLSLLWAGE
jgi:hypothetical protein